MHRIWLVSVTTLIAVACCSCGSKADPTVDPAAGATSAQASPSPGPGPTETTNLAPAATDTPPSAQTPQLASPTAAAASPTPTPRPTDIPTPDAIVVADVLNVREGPDTSFSIVKQVSKDTQLDVIGQYGNCSWLKVAIAGDVEGWVAGGQQYVTLGIACEGIAHGTYRPRTGTILASPQGGNLGELEVENGTDLDGVVIVSTSEGVPVTAVYIRAADSFTIRGIPDGTFGLYFSTGDDWDGDLNEFTSAVRYQRFDDSFVYATDSQSYTIWNVTLHSVEGGTARADSVDPADFPRISK